MNSRGLTGLVAVTLAAAATIAVFLYVRGVQDRGRAGVESVRVVVSKQDILAGTDLDDLIAEGAFTQTSVPREALVQGAITRLSQLEGRKTSTAVLAGEQISTARLEGSNELPGGVLGIPQGYQATTVGLESERIIGYESLQTGDRVAVYATFAPQSAGSGNGGGSTPGSGNGITVTLVPDAKVLKIERSQTNGAVGASDEMTLITIALKSRDSQALVFSQETGTVWLSMLPPGQVGVDNPPTTLLEVTR